MIQQSIIEKYNVPVPRYTSYPPANFFRELGEDEYRDAVKASNAAGDRRLSFYLHIPFCRHLCHYCACNSYPMQDSAVVSAYVEALHKELELLAALLDSERQIAQIHYGGGSPTTL